jgi:phosphoglycerol transferase MdoB-like AlkP superfamily enzyme
MFEQFVAKFENKLNVENIPRFGLFKMNEMSHDHLERLFLIDNDIKSLLVDLFTQKFLNNTLFILMGDHGHRQHTIRKTFIGKIEEKLPMFGMIVPRRILDNNKLVRENLMKNTKST